MKDKLDKLIARIPRMSGWILLTIVLLAVIYQISPKNLPILVYKGSLVTVAGVITYWLDRSLYSRMSDRINKEMPRDMLSSARVLSRALIFLAVVLGFSLGL